MNIYIYIFKYTHIYISIISIVISMMMMIILNIIYSDTYTRVYARTCRLTPHFDTFSQSSAREAFDAWPPLPGNVLVSLGGGDHTLMQRGASRD